MMILRSATLVLAALALAAPGISIAKDQGQGPAGKQGKAQQGHPHTSKKARSDPPRTKPCPPGLAKKNTGCLPPGQWRKGDRLPDSWAAQFIAYAALPDFYRSRYPVRPGRGYIYRDDRVFVIDAATRVIVDVILR